MKRTFIRAAGALAAVALLAGCAGAGVAPSAGNPSVVTQQSMAGGISFDAGKCTESKGIKVKPCTVTLSTTSPTADVKVKYPKGDDVSDNDKKCSSKDVATVTGAVGKYVVTAGTKAGSCSVVFTVTDGKKTVGTGTLSITNNL